MNETIRQVAPHFIAMILLYFLVFGFVAVVFQTRHVLLSLAIAITIAVFYPPTVRALGVAPETWER